MMHCRQQNLTYTAKNLEVLRERINVGCPCCHRRLSSGHVLARMRFFEIVRPHAARRFVGAGFAVIVVRAAARVAVAAMGSAWLFMRFVRMDGRSAAVAAPRHLWRETEKFFESGREKAAGWEVDRERMGDCRERITLRTERSPMIGCVWGTASTFNPLHPAGRRLGRNSYAALHNPPRRCSNLHAIAAAAALQRKAEAALFCFRLSHRLTRCHTAKTAIDGTEKRYV